MSNVTFTNMGGPLPPFQHWSKTQRLRGEAKELVTVIADSYNHTFNTEKPLPAWAEEKVALLRAAIDGEFVSIMGIGDAYASDGQYMFTLFTSAYLTRSRRG